MASTDKKRDSRKAVREPAWITLEGGFAARPCEVVDLSATGAKITLRSPQRLNSKLRLAFSRDARQGRNCEVVWRRGSTLGIRFTS